MRRFELHRKIDTTGVSGTGIVAQGVLFDDGAAAVRWFRGQYNSTTAHDKPTAFAAIDAIHGHHGNTDIVWLDSE